MVIEHLKKALKQYRFEKIDENNVEQVYELMKRNVYYYEKCEEQCSLAYCIEDISHVPPHKTVADKGYYAFYEVDTMVGVVDYIIGYPHKQCLFLGLFMLDVEYHHKQVGAQIIRAILAVAKTKGFSEVRLMCYKNNEIGAHFWQKMGFCILEEFTRENDTRILYRMVQYI